MAFKDLDTKTRYDLIRAGVRAGITKVSDIERLFDEGGHLHAEDGDIDYISNPTEVNRAVVMGQIGENPELLFTPEYSQWRSYIMKNSPKYLDRLWNNLSYEKQQQIFKSNPKAFSALSNEAQAAFAGNKVREATDKAAPYAAMIPLAGAGLAASAIMPATGAVSNVASKVSNVLTKPYQIANAAKTPLGRIAGQALASEAGGRTVSEAVKAVTGKSWDENAIEIANNFGLNPQNSLLGQIAIGMTNPGYWTPAGVVENTALKGSQIARDSKEINKRLAETVLRTTGDHNPLPKIKEGLQDMKSTKEGRERLKNIAKYILLNERNGEKGYYNSFAKRPQHYYTGFKFPSSGMYEGRKLGNDMIDAFLYGKEIDPEYGLKLISKGKPKDFGPYKEKYIPENYSDKLKDIQVYEMDNSFKDRDFDLYDHNIQFLSNEDVKKLNIQPEINENGLLKVKSGGDSTIGMEHFFSNLDKNTPAVDVGGHLYTIGKGDTGSEEIYRQGWDIWKFNPTDYMKRWLKAETMDPIVDKYGYIKPDTNTTFKEKTKQHLKNKLFEQGLKFIDKQGTPVITKSKWASIRKRENIPYYDDKANNIITNISEKEVANFINKLKNDAKISKLLEEMKNPVEQKDFKDTFGFKL